MKKLTKLVASALILGSLGLATLANAAPQKSYLDIKDPTGDDKGTGYYQYPLDKRITRGTYDIKNFKVYEEGSVVVFEIKMRNYIMRTWEDSGKSENQGFVANLWDIYIDIDGIEKSGFEDALPGRDVLFADKMGWEKVVMISPMEPAEVEEILRGMTDDIEFQDKIEHIIIPDYVEIQGNILICKISKKKLPRLSEKSGFQLFSMGYKNVVSANRLLNRDVKAFPTKDDFGGGSNDYGEPTVIDCIMPNGCDQYKFLKNYTTAAYRDNIRYADVPFVYANGNRVSPAVEAIRRAPLANQPVVNQQPKPVMQPLTPRPVMQQVVPQQVAPQQVAPQTNMQPIPQRQMPVNRVAPQQPQGQQRPSNGFVPLKQQPQPQRQPTYNSIPSGFVPVKKNK